MARWSQDQRSQSYETKLWVSLVQKRLHNVCEAKSTPGTVLEVTRFSKPKTIHKSTFQAWIWLSSKFCHETNAT